ncbi:MAG: DUF4369 domain-containing protein [Prevotella sp.]|nr:DUF4369 domain-containing protein [Prevotella sp.]
MMKRALHLSVVPLMAVVFTLVAALVCTSCGTDSRHFRIDGRLLHLNQGEFYVYSPDGTINGLDTIKVQAGRFSYEVACDRPMTLMIVFPNFTEQPVFAQPGKSVDLKGDASHLKEMTVKGTKDNELMNKFREMIRNAAPPEMKKCAQLFVQDHPESRVGAYLVDRYFIHDANPDTKTAVRLVDLMIEKQPENGYLKRQKRQLTASFVATKGADIPNVLGTTVDGKTIGRVQLTKAPVTVVCALATWKYESMSQFRRLAAYAASQQGRVAVVGVSIDASPYLLRSQLASQIGISDSASGLAFGPSSGSSSGSASGLATGLATGSSSGSSSASASAAVQGSSSSRSSSTCYVVCDGKMVESPFFTRLGLTGVPDNIVIKNGRIAAAHLTDNQLTEFIKEKQK